ncbi:hypothetical protein [Paraflavitalea speifideaquila]|uniref:hypothetical protein n=1 Tax=Paraflavitalea speifideaquila TaxID=3076558 RepID=UPI0028E9B6C0|nr:hypothetical protein [Paraflavitalea speifideiaquila]
MLQKKEIKEDQKISTLIKKELAELKTMQQQQQTSPEELILYKLQKNAEEKQALDAKQRIIYEKKKRYCLKNNRQRL